MFDLNQAFAAAVAAALICSIWVLAVALFAMVEEYRIQQSTGWCPCRSCLRFRQRHRKCDLLVTVMAALFTVPAGLFQKDTQHHDPDWPF